MMKSRIFFYTAVFGLISMVSCDESISPQPVEPNQDSTSDYLFTSDEGEKFEVWNATNNELTQLTFEQDKDAWWPQVNKQSSKILFYESNKSRTVNDYSSATLHTMNLDGTEKTELLALSQNNQFVQQGLASWSHSGNTIIFSALESDQQYWQIYELDLSSNAVKRISTNLTKNYLDPIYGIDDASIYCVTTNDDASVDAKNDVFEIDLTTGDEIQITKNSTQDHHPCISPNGQTILFESLTDEEYLGIGKWEIRSYDLNSGTETALISDDNIRLFPHFSSDGNRVYFTQLILENASLGIGAYKIDEQELQTLNSNGNNAMNVYPY